MTILGMMDGYHGDEDEFGDFQHYGICHCEICDDCIDIKYQLADDRIDFYEEMELIN
jgi:hypothetical protein